MHILKIEGSKAQKKNLAGDYITEAGRKILSRAAEIPLHACDRPNFQQQGSLKFLKPANETRLYAVVNTRSVAAMTKLNCPCVKSPSKQLIFPLKCCDSVVFKSCNGHASRVE